MLSTKVVNVLVAIIAFCEVAVAFYPFTPDYRCIRDPKCDPSGLLNVPSVEGRATTLKLKQRLPEVGLIPSSLLTILIEAVLGATSYPGPSPS